MCIATIASDVCKSSLTYFSFCADSIVIEMSSFVVDTKDEYNYTMNVISSTHLHNVNRHVSTVNSI